MKENKIFSKIFMWMFLGLLVTFGVAYYISTNENMVYNIFSGGKYWIVWIAELVVVIWLSARITKMNPMTAKILFLLYSLLTGITLSSIFVIYEITSIVFVFLISAVVFLIMGLIGYFTKIDLTKLGTILMMALLAIIIASIINIFIGSEVFNLGLCIVGLIVFLGFVAYDIQKIKKMLPMFPDEDNLAIYGALELYLDFINIFLRLLQLFGNERD